MIRNLRSPSLEIGQRTLDIETLVTALETCQVDPADRGQ